MMSDVRAMAALLAAGLLAGCAASGGAAPPESTLAAMVQEEVHRAEAARGVVRRQYVDQRVEQRLRQLGHDDDRIRRLEAELAAAKSRIDALAWAVEVARLPDVDEPESQPVSASSDDVSAASGHVSAPPVAVSAPSDHVSTPSGTVVIPVTDAAVPALAGTSGTVEARVRLPQADGSAETLPPAPAPIVASSLAAGSLIAGLTKGQANDDAALRARDPHGAASQTPQQTAVQQTAPLQTAPLQTAALPEAVSGPASRQVTAGAGETRPASGQGIAAPVVSEPDVRGAHLASYRGPGAALRGWSVLAGRYPAVLANHEPVLVEVSTDRGIFVRLVTAVGRPDSALRRVCDQIRDSGGEYCRIVTVSR